MLRGRKTAQQGYGIVTLDEFQQYYATVCSFSFSFSFFFIFIFIFFSFLVRAKEPYVKTPNKKVPRYLGPF
jgi:hypothetical protein